VKLANYVGDRCSGCDKFKPYIDVIPFNPAEDICHSCFNVIPEHVPHKQHKKYLRKKYK
jgi:hypothetical protein